MHAVNVKKKWEQSQNVNKKIGVCNDSLYRQDMNTQFAQESRATQSRETGMKTEEKLFTYTCMIARL